VSTATTALQAEDLECPDEVETEFAVLLTVHALLATELEFAAIKIALAWTVATTTLDRFLLSKEMDLLELCNAATLIALATRATEWVNASTNDALAPLAQITANLEESFLLDLEWNSLENLEIRWECTPCNET